MEFTLAAPGCRDKWSLIVSLAMEETLAKLGRLRHRGSYWFLHRYAWDLAATPAADGQGAELVEVNGPDLEDMRRSCPDLTERKHAQLQERIGAADITAYLIRARDGRWAGYCHTARRRFDDHYLSHVVRLRPHEVLLLDDQVFPSHRRQGLHTYSVRRRSELARERGATRGLVVINDRNTASVATYTGAGARPVRRLVLVRPFKVMLQFPVRGR